MSIEDRLARLERENRRLKVAGLLVLLATVSVFLMGQARPAQRIMAGSFAVTNTSGDVVAILGSDGERGMPYLNLYAPGQNFPSISIALAVSELSNPQNSSLKRTALTPSVTLYQPLAPGANTTMSLGLSLDMFDHTPRISFTSESGQTPLQMSSTGIQIADPNGVTLWQAP
jgi:hypothetical protein